MSSRVIGSALAMSLAAYSCAYAYVYVVESDPPGAPPLPVSPASLLPPTPGGSPFNQDPLAGMRQTPAFQAAFQQGVAEAEKELAEGRATAYTFGLGMALDNLDCETGLPYKAIAGCVIDESILGRTEGHASRIRQAFKAGQIPANSLKAWEKELFNLKAFFEAESASRKPQPLEPNGAWVESPSGDALRVATEMKVIGDRPHTNLTVEVRSGGKTSEPLWLWADAAGTSTFDVLWGPPGSGFAVVREIDPHARPVSYTAVDVRHGLVLRRE